MRKVGTSLPLVGYSNIFMLNGYSLPTDKNTIDKYFPLDRFIKTTDSNELVFVSPEAWYDPFEQRFYGIECSSRGYKTEDIACICFSEKSIRNEDACWKVYASSGEKAVRVSFNYMILLQFLDEYAKSNGFRVFIGQANYSLEKKDIKELHNPDAANYNEYFPDKMTRENYLSLMLLKRKSFEYENEIRFFLVKDTIKFDKDNLLKIPCDYKAQKLVSNVTLSPFPRMKMKDSKLFRAYRQIQRTESDQMKKYLNDKLGCRVQQSRLYEDCRRIELV